MSIHAISSDTPVNEPRLRRGLKMIYQIAKLSAHKAALHFKDPQHFPLERARCFEQIFLQHIKQLPAGKQQQKVAAAMAIAEAPVEQRARSLGAMAGVNLQSPISVSEQVFGSARARAAVPDLARIPDDDDKFPRRGPGGIDKFPLPGGGTGKLPVKRLVLRVHRVKCIKETGEWGKDEIDLAASAVTITNVAGTPQFSKEMLVEPFRVGSFKSGNERFLGDKILYPFYPPDPDKFPAIWLVAVLLIEKDSFSKAKKVRERLRQIQDQLFTEVKKLANVYNLEEEGRETVLKGLILVLIVLLVNAIIGLFNDEFFDPGVIGLSVDSANSQLLQEGHETPRNNVTLVREEGRDGKYEVTYSWAVIK